jgi:hypothetical protein
MAGSRVSFAKRPAERISRENASGDDPEKIGSRHIRPFSRCPIGLYSPKLQSDNKRIDAQREPEGQLADPMLFCIAGGAQRNGAAIAQLHASTTIGF